MQGSRKRGACSRKGRAPFLVDARARAVSARVEGVTAETPVAECANYFGWDYLGGGSPYEKETSVVPIPH